MKDRIKVVVGVNDFLVGGAQKFIADLLVRMDRDRFELVLITLFEWPNKDYLYDLVPKDVPVYKFRFQNFFDISEWFSLYKTLRKISPQVVVSNLFFSNVIFRVLKPFLSYQVVTVEHNTYTDRKFLERFVDRGLSRITHSIVAVSTTVAEYMSARERIPRDKFTVIHNGIDVSGVRRTLAELPEKKILRSEFGLGANDVIALNVSRLTSQKNHQLLIQGFKIFKEKNSLTKLLIVGDGALRTRLEAQVASLGLEKSVIFFGLRRDVWKFYKLSDFFVAASDIEGLSISFLEAQAAGLPLVATRTAGTDEIVTEGVNGFFIAGSKPEYVAEALEKMTSCDINEMSQDTLRSIERFDIAGTIVKYSGLIETAARS